MITSAGVVSTIAGGTSSGSADGIGTAALFSNHKGIAVDSSGNLYVTDQNNNTVRKITYSGGVYTVSTIAGANGTTLNGLGSTDGAGTAAKFNIPIGIAVDSSGNLYVADSGNNLIKMITSGGVVSTIAGGNGGTSSGSANGIGTAALFKSPRGIVVDSSGNLYVADYSNNTIRKLLLQASVTFNSSGPLVATNNTSAGALTMTTAGTINVQSGIAATLDTPPAGSNQLSVTGTLAVITALNASTTPIDVSGSGTTLQVSGNGALPNAATSVATGAILELGADKWRGSKWSSAWNY